MIVLENISKKFGNQQIVQPTSYAFRPELTTAVIGPSGCGKSTLLKIIIGLITTDTGRVLWNDVEISKKNLADFRHRMGYVVQDGGLFPHMTALQNVRLVSDLLKRPSADVEERVEYLIDLVQMPRQTLQQFPGSLSGGQRQRIGIMRALMLDPQVIILDEPFSALDPITKTDLQAELKRIFTPLKKTVIIVTHDMHEAAYFGHEIVLMRGGKIVQHGPFEDLISNPSEPYVLQFIRAQHAFTDEAGAHA